METRLIDKLAEKHWDWIRMAKSFGADSEQSNELVQAMYVRLVKYVDADSERIMYTKEEVNTYYVYVTLRNLFLSGAHSYKSDYDLIESFVYEKTYIHEDLDMRYEQAHKDLFDKVDSIVDKWYWYDKKLWGIHFNDKVSMRGIASDTKISLSSIFNTLKNGKEKVRKQVQKEYEDYCKAKEERADEYKG
tara:strand:+ start:160 stop:729 length:570 start_codon:yes stop_codon:yes gene_type:complete